MYNIYQIVQSGTASHEHYPSALSRHFRIRNYNRRFHKINDPMPVWAVSGLMTMLRQHYKKGITYSNTNGEGERVHSNCGKFQKCLHILDSSIEQNKNQ